ncbi:MAG: hypothetical protein IJC19_05970 [Clostridia bacterium]|nr:hypothetical protein [Clostridia bacterium]
MFLFGKKEMDKAAAEAFWVWFEEREAWIIECLDKRDSAFIWAIDEKLKPVFPYFKKELEFQLGYNNGVGEFFFFHFGKKDLMRDANALADRMPSSLKERWRFISEA